jgi:hypothetical protein
MNACASRPVLYALLVPVKGKATLLLKAYGKSDVEGDVPMTVDTIIAIGSDTKQFTAAAILKLRDQGKLSLDDEITKWLPDFDTGGDTVTLRHLLGHTSGVTETPTSGFSVWWSRRRAGRGLDVPPESGASHLPPERERWSGDGTAVRQRRWPLHPQAAVEAISKTAVAVARASGSERACKGGPGDEVPRVETWQRIGSQPGLR